MKRLLPVHYDNQEFEIRRANVAALVMKNEALRHRSEAETHTGPQGEYNRYRLISLSEREMTMAVNCEKYAEAVKFGETRNRFSLSLVTGYEPHVREFWEAAGLML